MQVLPFYRSRDYDWLELTLVVPSIALILSTDSIPQISDSGKSDMQKKATSRPLLCAINYGRKKFYGLGPARV